MALCPARQSAQSEVLSAVCKARRINVVEFGVLVYAHGDVLQIYEKQAKG